MNNKDHSDSGHHVQVGQGLAAIDHGTINTRDVHNYYGTNQSPQPTLRELLSFPEMQGRERKVEIAHDGTCEWFVHTHQYSTWTGNPRNDWRDNIIWITGNAGAGKSTLMKFAVEHAREAASGELILPHFFNARGQLLEHSIEGMWRTLIVWILDELPEAAVQRLSSPYRRYSSKEWDVPELERVLKKAVREVDNRSITFYIDALDECNEKDVDRMLWIFCDVLKKAHESGHRVRVCLASRPYPAITFTNAIFLDLHRQNDHLTDIDQYIQDRLEIGSSIIAVTIQAEIRQKANGIFMWLVLVVDMLNTDFRNGNIHTLQDRLKEIPGDLRDLFVYTLERYKEDRPAMLVCFRWLLFGVRQNLLSEVWWMMQVGLGRPDEEVVRDYQVLDEYDMERQIVSRTKGFVEVMDYECHFMHESIREFILKDCTLLGAEHPSEFEATSHELLRDWCFAEVLASQPIVIDLLFQCDEHGRINAESERLVDERRPLSLDASQRTMLHAENAQKCGRDQVAWLNKFSHITGHYIIHDDDYKTFLIVHDVMSLLLHSECESLIRETQLEPTRRGRSNGLALGFKDTGNGHLCPVLLAAHWNKEPFSEALIQIYLALEPRSSRLQNLMQEEASKRFHLKGDHLRYSLPLLDLATENEHIAIFFLFALTPPSALEPHLDRLERIFKEDYSAHFIWVLDIFIEQQLLTDAIDPMSPELLEFIKDYRLEKLLILEVLPDAPGLKKVIPTLSQMEATLRSRGV